MKELFSAVCLVVVISIVYMFACDPPTNQKVNFDFCKAHCVDAGTPMKTFEQGLGYVKCECSKP